jgi:hypothetical protein
VRWADDGPVVTAVVRCDPVIHGPSVAPMWPTLAQPSTVRVVDRRRGGDHTQLMTTPAPRCPTCGSLLTSDKHSLLAPGERLTPWMIHDLPRIAWIVEYRAAELTDEERQIVRDATTRMLRGLEHDTV